MSQASLGTKKHSRIRLLIYVVLLALAFQFILSFSSSWVVDRLSFKTEKRVGALYSQSVSQGIFFDISKALDPRAIGFLNQLSQRLWQGLDSPIPSPKITVHHLGEANAYALPDRSIVVTTDLLKEIRNENELSWVLGHELGHVYSRHALKRLGRKHSFSFFSSLMGGPIYPWGDLSQLFLSPSHSRNEELQADLIALELVQNHYGHVGSCLGFLLRQGERTEGQEAYFSSHPSPQERHQKMIELSRLKAWETQGKPASLPPFLKQSLSLGRQK